MDAVCYIVGACEPGEIVIDRSRPSLVIAADAGLRRLEERGIVPELILGDFDSLGEIPAGTQVLRWPVEKDDTDSMLAIKEGLFRGLRTFILYGCVGGRRPDHTYANYQSLDFLVRHGGRGCLVGDGWAVTAVRNSALAFSPEHTGSISVFCPDGEARGVALRGLYYPLEDAVLTSGFPLGVSNHFTGVEASVSVEEGTLLVMWEETPAGALAVLESGK